LCEAARCRAEPRNTALIISIIIISAAFYLRH
jgi:hypothetical protein